MKPCAPSAAACMCVQNKLRYGTSERSKDISPLEVSPGRSRLAKWPLARLKISLLVSYYPSSSCQNAAIQEATRLLSATSQFPPQTAASNPRSSEQGRHSKSEQARSLGRARGHGVSTHVSPELPHGEAPVHGPAAHEVVKAGIGEALVQGLQRDGCASVVGRKPRAEESWEAGDGRACRRRARPRAHRRRHGWQVRRQDRWEGVPFRGAAPVRSTDQQLEDEHLRQPRRGAAAGRRLRLRWLRRVRLVAVRLLRWPQRRPRGRRRIRHVRPVHCGRGGRGRRPAVPQPRG